MFGLRDEPIENSPEARKTIRGLLAFRRTEGRPSAMNSFNFVYPSAVLADIEDPLAIAREHNGAQLPGRSGGERGIRTPGTREGSTVSRDSDSANRHPLEQATSCS